MSNKFQYNSSNNNYEKAMLMHRKSNFTKKAFFENVILYIRHFFVIILF